LDTHLYHFADTVQEMEDLWDLNLVDIKRIASKVPLLIGEWTMAGNKDIPTPDL
jgi:hypothetical protein